MIGSGRVTIKLIGTARYQLSALCHSGRRVTVDLWTTKKGTITTRLHDLAAWATVRLGSDGNLQELDAADCSLHLEHMDRGHYYLGLECAAADAMHVDFNTIGYIKTKMTEDNGPQVGDRRDT